MSDRHGETDRSPRTLAGAIVLQIVPALREEPAARTALIVTRALLQAGARALVAGEDGPLVAELQGFGGEWVPLVNATANPFKLRSAARKLERLIASEQSTSCTRRASAEPGARTWRQRRSRCGSWPRCPTCRRYPGCPVTGRAGWPGADWVITPSNFAAAPMVARYKIPRERLSIIPRSIDTDAFDATAIAPERIAALRISWRIAAEERILLVPGRVAPWNGQLILPEVARALHDGGVRGFVFVLAGEHHSHRKYARAVVRAARAKGVGELFRLAGHCRDMAAAFAAADTVVFPATEPPMLGRAVAQAQAVGRPVVTSDVGILPEQIAAPPELPEDVRTGWVVKAGDAIAFAEAIRAALSLDDAAYRAMAARARQFARYMFAPESIANATRSVYTALLARDM